MIYKCRFVDVRMNNLNFLIKFKIIF